jgi:hypothetical protein
MPGHLHCYFSFDFNIFIHSLWVENPVALARLFQLLKLALDKPYKTE